jgi:uncharacterized protein
VNFFQVSENKSFIGRRPQIEQLTKIHSQKAAGLIVVYGRRRVGKTELIEQFFRKEPILKFEGLQQDPGSGTNKAPSTLRQIWECQRRLSVYLGDTSILEIEVKTWSQFFEILSPHVTKSNVILYFEEIQWLSNYSSDFLAAMKPFWDDKWRHNSGLRIVLSGSAPSFLVAQFLSDKALYARSEHLIEVEPFNLQEIDLFLQGRGRQEKLLAALTLGGIPEYLKRIQNEPSVLIGLCENAFKKNAYFVKEAEKIFVSSFAANKHFRNIIEYLSKRKHSTREELAAKLVGPKAGGSFTAVLDDLEKCGFIGAYTPVTSKSVRNSKRYQITDEYLNFYYNFIRPVEKQIVQGKYQQNPTEGINRQKFSILLGFAFERWVRKNETLISKILGFSGIDYHSGPFFAKNDAEFSGFQIDLAFVRKDHTLTVCEAKYGQGDIRLSVVSEMNKKIDALLAAQPKFRNWSVQRVLISPEAPQDPAITDYFDRVITLDEIFGACG